MQTFYILLLRRKIRRCYLDNKKILVNCVKSLYSMGLTSPVSGNHSIRIRNKKWMWITPSGVPRYNLQEQDLVRVNLETSETIGRLKPSIEWQMHTAIYRKLSQVNAIIHTHSPYTLGIAISAVDKFQHILEEAKVVVGNPVIISNRPSGSIELANTVSRAFGVPQEEIRAVIIRNHGVVTVGNDIHKARAVVESLEEWAKIWAIIKLFGGPKYVFDECKPL